MSWPPEHFNPKNDIFSSIMDQIRQHSHSWASKFLNGVGKQVLLSPNDSSALLHHLMFQDYAIFM